MADVALDRCAGDAADAVDTAEIPASPVAPADAAGTGGAAADRGAGGEDEAQGGDGERARDPAATLSTDEHEATAPPQLHPADAGVQPQAAGVPETALAARGDDEDTEDGGEPTPEADARSNSIEGEDAAAAPVEVPDGDAPAAAEAPEAAVDSTERLAQVARASVAKAIVQPLQEQKNELGIALAIPRCEHLCRFDAKVTPADQKCLEPACDLHNFAVCATCSDSFHANEEMRKHRQSVISTCPQCQLEPSYYYCTNCDLTFCAPCFRVIHAPSKVQTHKTFILEGRTSGVLRDKRKRDATDPLDVIMVDSDSDNDDRFVLEAAPAPRRNNQVDGLRNPNYCARSKYMNPGMQNLGLNRIVSSDAYDTDSSAGVIGPSGTPTPSRIEEAPAAPFVAQPPVAPPAVAPPPQQHTTDGWGTSSTGSSPMGMYYGRASNDFTAADIGSAHDFAAAAGTLHPASSVPMGAAGTGTLITTAADWTANPLEDILYDRYLQINLYTVNLEQHITRLNARIVQTSVENLAAAQQMTLTLRQQQVLLQKAQLNRNSALVALIVQSNSIMGKVKRLRMDMLSDIAQVPISSHRRCLELSQQIAQYTGIIAALHQQMAVVLDSSGGMDPDTFHQNVSSVNKALQANEQSILGWKEERENEIVRVVQYSSAIREDLKRTFHGQKQPTPQQRQHGYQ